MRVLLSQKLLPLALCFAVGVGLAFSFDSARRAKRRGGCATFKEAAKAEAHSRTWLVIRSRPKPRGPLLAGIERSLATAWFRVRFGADGTVAQVRELSQPSATSRESRAAVEGIKFSPPTEDGRPLAVTADVMFETATDCIDQLGGHGRVCFRNPFSMAVHIAAVEGAENAEGWRVAYE